MTYLHFLFCCHMAASMPREQHVAEVERGFPTRSWILKWGPLYPLATRCVMFDSDLFIRRKTLCFLHVYTWNNCLHKDWNFLKDLEKWFSSSWAVFHPTSSKWSLLRVDLVGLCVNLPLFFWLIRSECLCVSLFVCLVCLSASCKSTLFYSLWSCIVLIITMESLISAVKEFLCIQPSFSALSKLFNYKCYLKLICW